MNKTTNVLTIAGSDSVGGAGIQTDIRTIFSTRCYASSCITAVTAQNSLGVRSIMAVDETTLRNQIDAVLEDITINAIKIGMIYTKQNVVAIKNALKTNNYNGFIVLDPVLVATSGDSLAQMDFLSTLEKELFPLCDVLTPNIPEAEMICNCKIKTIEDIIECGRQIIESFGVKNVLIKGGHADKDEMTDILIRNDSIVEAFSAPKINTKNTHGTGCTLSSAIASFLAKGYSLTESIRWAKEFVYQALQNSKDYALGKGPSACLIEQPYIIMYDSEEKNNVKVYQI